MMNTDSGSAAPGRAIPVRVSASPRSTVITNWVTNTVVNGTISAAMTAPNAISFPAKSSLASAYPAADAATMLPATTMTATTMLLTRKPPKPSVLNSRTKLSRVMWCGSQAPGSERISSRLRREPLSTQTNGSSVSSAHSTSAPYSRGRATDRRRTRVRSSAMSTFRGAAMVVMRGASAIGTGRCSPTSRGGASRRTPPRTCRTRRLRTAGRCTAPPTRWSPAGRRP